MERENSWDRRDQSKTVCKRTSACTHHLCVGMSLSLKNVVENWETGSLHQNGGHSLATHKIL